MKPLVCMNTHTCSRATHTHTHFWTPQSQRVCRTPSHIIPSDNAPSKSIHPNSPPSSHFHPSSLSLSSAPIYLLSHTLPVSQKLRPANPFWKETTEQKITSPPLSHTPSLPFVFSSGLLLTPLQRHHQHSLPPASTSVHSDVFPTSPLWLFFLYASSPSPRSLSVKLGCHLLIPQPVTEQTHHNRPGKIDAVKVRQN